MKRSQHLTHLLVLLIVCSFTVSVTAQNDVTKWEKDIAKFESQDKKSPPEKGGVLFLGSSSIRMWDLPKCFPDQKYLNRGFGGSEISDSIHYHDRLVTVYEPRCIVFYAGDNDIAKKKSADKVFEDFKTFFRITNEKFPKAKIVFVAIKPSLKRWGMVAEMRKANKHIADFAKTNPRVVFADIDSPMIGADKKPRADLFLEDGLHLNKKGYEVWTSVIKPLLN